MITPYLKSAGKVKKEKTSTLRNKADKLFQELGRLHYSDCLVCGKEYSCLHHYFPKSTSTALRYDFENGINLCQGCHFSLHNSNPAIQNTINEVKGEEWLKELTWRKHNLTVKPNNEWYKCQIEILQTMINAFK